MLCEQCRIREANIVIREVINGNVSERRLCSQCASAGELGGILDGSSAFARLLSGIMGLAGSSENSGDRKAASELSCPNCGMSYGEFTRDSRFGCSECYSAFGPLIFRNIKNLQGGNTHTGKKPVLMQAKQGRQVNVMPEKKEISPEEQLEIYREKQKEAVRNEDYEKAAWYRDEIKKLQGKE